MNGTWARWIFVGVFFSVAVGGCGDDMADPTDSSVMDGGGDADAGRDGSADAGDSGDAGDGGALPRTCVSPSGADPAGTDTWDDAAGRATVSMDDRASCLRTYTLGTTAVLRDGEPDNPRTVTEGDGGSTLRSGNDLFDALYALALDEVRELSVSEIRDFAFNDGMPVACPPGGCFETGRLWNYVWTRDTAYAVDLGLSPLDPTRSRNSLEFKLSERRAGGDRQIVQDTGSGGSYPVSSDRVSWAMGAAALLPHLDGAEREAFVDITLDALGNTLEHDRRVVYDPADGLYRGEQSFLDWREQSYPEWTAVDVVHISMSKALSTNVLHYRAMTLAADLFDERGDSMRRDRYRGWANDLRTSIRARMWDDDAGQLSSFTTTGLDPAPTRRWDALGSALAILTGIADTDEAARMLASYPHYGPGVPVLFPQQQQTRIYHNRGEWPFVTAYWLRAAKMAGNDAVADRMVRALIRGAAINLSNMENFEASTGAVFVDEGATSGPVVNSQRQLWSVAGYLAMVHRVLFGIEATDEGLQVMPFLTPDLRNTLFGDTDTLVLNDYPYRGRTFTVVLHLPPMGGEGGAYGVGEMTLNGGGAFDRIVPSDRMEAQNRIDVVITDTTLPRASLTERTDADWRDVFGPRTPRITSVDVMGSDVRLSLDAGGETRADVSFAVYRDGVRVAEGLAGTTATYTDTDADPATSPCYVVETCFTGSGNCSQHSPPMCWWGVGASAITTIDASSMVNVGGSGSSSHGRFHYEPWGDPGHRLTANGFTATRSGTHLIQVTFGNGAGSIDSGITCAVKRVRVEDEADGSLVASGFLVMPHLGDWSRWEDSNFVPATLTSGRSYRIIIEAHDEAANMSAFDHFESYTGGSGGAAGELNRVNIAELKILAR